MSSVAARVRFVVVGSQGRADGLARSPLRRDPVAGSRASSMAHRPRSIGSILRPSHRAASRWSARRPSGRLGLNRSPGLVVSGEGRPTCSNGAQRALNPVGAEDRGVMAQGGDQGHPTGSARWPSSSRSPPSWRSVGRSSLAIVRRPSRQASGSAPCSWRSQSRLELVSGSRERRMRPSDPSLSGSSAA